MLKSADVNANPKAKDTNRLFAPLTIGIYSFLHVLFKLHSMLANGKFQMKRNCWTEFNQFIINQFLHLLFKLHLMLKMASFKWNESIEPSSINWQSISFCTCYSNYIWCWRTASFKWNEKLLNRVQSIHEDLNCIHPYSLIHYICSY